jgi:hypothetical protein
VTLKSPITCVLVLTNEQRNHTYNNYRFSSEINYNFSNIFIKKEYCEKHGVNYKDLIGKQISIKGVVNKEKMDLFIDEIINISEFSSVSNSFLPNAKEVGVVERISDVEKFYTEQCSIKSLALEYSSYKKELDFIFFNQSESSIANYEDISSKYNIPLHVAMNIVEELFFIRNNHSYVSFLKYHGFKEKNITDFIRSNFKGVKFTSLISNVYSLSRYMPSCFDKINTVANSLSDAVDLVEKAVALTADYVYNVSRNGSNKFYFQALLTHISLKAEDVTQEHIEQGFDRYKWFTFIDNDKTFFTTQKMLSTESYVIGELIKYSSDSPQKSVSRTIKTFVKEYESKYQRKLDGEQLRAINLTKSKNRIFFVNGKAGTGKTTTSELIIKFILKESGLTDADVVCGSFSGLSSNKIGEVTGYRSETIHSLLGMTRNSDNVKYNERNKLKEKVFIIDECFMLSNSMVENLLRAIDIENSFIVFVGDSNQLSSIGQGDLLKHVVYSDKIKSKVFLKNVYRSNVNILSKLNSLLSGDGYLDLKTGNDNYYYVGLTSDHGDGKSVNEDLKLKMECFLEDYCSDLQNKLLQIKANSGSDVYSYARLSSNFFKIIAPHKTSFKDKYISAEYINHSLRAQLNPFYSDLDKNVACFSVKDDEDKHVVSRVCIGESILVISNITTDVINRDSGLTEKSKVYNGESGVVVSVSEDNLISVYFPIKNQIVRFNEGDWKVNIDYGYSFSIHKSQGAEFENVLLILPYTKGFESYYSVQMLYAAMSRSKTNLCVLAEDSVFLETISINEANRKNTITTMILDKM